MDADTENKVKQLKEIWKIQEEEVKGQATPYMVGLFNGLEISLSIFEDRQPIYKNIDRSEDSPR